VPCVNTSVNTAVSAVLTQSGQQGDLISVPSSPSSSPTPIAAQPVTTASKTQVSSSMAPPLAPVINGTWVQPHGLPANAAPMDPNATEWAQTLPNSGVSVLTDYPLSTSPRMSSRQINKILGTQYSRMPNGAPLALPAPSHRAVSLNANFQSFSWDSTVQPRTAAARAYGLRDDISPGTKESSKKRKHAEPSKGPSKKSKQTKLPKK
jgi:hypothetical protein